MGSLEFGSWHHLRNPLSNKTCWTSPCSPFSTQSSSLFWFSSPYSNISFLKLPPTSSSSPNFFLASRPLFLPSPISYYQLHYSWSSENITTLNHHHGELVILATRPMLLGIVPHSKNPLPALPGVVKKEKKNI